MEYISSFNVGINYQCYIHDFLFMNMQKQSIFTDFFFISAFVDLPCLCLELEILDVSGCYNITVQTIKSFRNSGDLWQSNHLTMYIGGK